MNEWLKAIALLVFSQVAIIGSAGVAARIAVFVMQYPLAAFGLSAVVLGAIAIMYGVRLLSSNRGASGSNS